MVQVRDLTICVPVRITQRIPAAGPKVITQFEEKLLRDSTRIRRVVGGRSLCAKITARKELADGKAKSICLVIRDLTALARKYWLNDDDKNILRRAESLLCAEWAYSMSVPLAQRKAIYNRCW